MSISEASFGDHSRRQSLSGCMVLALIAGTAWGNPTKSADPMAAPEVYDAQETGEDAADAKTTKTVAVERIKMPSRGLAIEFDVTGLDETTAFAKTPFDTAMDKYLARVNPGQRVGRQAQNVASKQSIMLHAEVLVEVDTRRTLIEVLGAAGLIRGQGWVAENTEALEGTEGMFLVQFPTVRAAVQAAEMLLQDDRVAFANVSKTIPKVNLALPTDPLVAQQYFFDNPVPSAPVPSLNQDHNLSDAYELGMTGAGVQIGILEAFDYSYQAFSPEVQALFEDPLGVRVHPDLMVNHDQSLSQLYNPFTTELEFGHGNAVAGLIAAGANNGEGGAGIAYNATIAGLINGNDTRTAQALLWRNDVLDIKNHSWGFLVGSSPGFIGPGTTYPSDPGLYTLDGSPPGRALRGANTDDNVFNVVSAGNGGAYIPSVLPTHNNYLLIDDQGAIVEIGSDDFNGSVFPGTWMHIGERTEMSSTAKWREVLAIGAVGENNAIAGYSTTGTNVIASAYSQGSDNIEASLGNNPFAGERGIVTADAVDGINAGGLGDGYQPSFNGTSASAPIATGILALMLEANPNLTLRDIKYILQGTSDWTRIAGVFPELSSGRYTSFGEVAAWTVGAGSSVGSTMWQVNGAFNVHSDAYGFGIIDAEAAVNAAMNFGGAPQQIILDSGVVAVDLAIPSPDYFEPAELVQTINPDTLIIASNNFMTICVRPNIIVEEVEVTLNIVGGGPGDLLIGLEGPYGSNSLLAYPRVDGGIFTGIAYSDYKFNSYKHWGELSGGPWTLQVADVGPDTPPDIVGEEDDGVVTNALAYFPPGTTYGIEGVHEEKTVQDWRLRIYGSPSDEAPYTLCETTSLSCPGDWNGDGQVTPEDLLAFLDLWLAGSFLTDIDGNGFVEYNDLLLFYLLWQPGRCLEDPLNPGNGRIADDPFVIGVG